MNWHPARLAYASLVASAVIGVACGSDARTPTAAATPAPVATPTPAPAATPQAFTCHLPAMLDRQKYQTAVVAAINAQGGICAKDDNEEVAAKMSNDFNEQFNIWTSAGYTRRSYITTCFPAQF